MINLNQLVTEMKIEYSSQSGAVYKEYEDSPVKGEHIYVMKKEVFIPQIKNTLELFLFVYQGDKRLPNGYYHGYSNRIYMNIHELAKLGADNFYYVACHEYWHQLQAINGFPFNGEATPEEAEYYTRTLRYWKKGEYLTKNKAEMGAELFAALLGFNKSYFKGISKNTDLLLKGFKMKVVMKNELYKTEWERINKVEEMFHKPLDYKNGFK